MLILNLSSKLEQRLSEWAANNYQSKDYSMQLAFEEFLDDYDDYCRILNVSKYIKE